MKDILKNINKAFESKVRLGIMSMLMVNDRVDFKTFKEQLGLSDGNLASHIKTLEKMKFVVIEKSFVGKKPNTALRATTEGKVAFKEHLKALERIIRG